MLSFIFYKQFQLNLNTTVILKNKMAAASDEKVGQPNYVLENGPQVHANSLKSALENLSNEDPDVAVVTENGDKVFIHRIILSMYSPIIRDVLVDFKSSEMPVISLPVASSSVVLNLLKVLTRGLVLSTDPDSLHDVGIAAEVLNISLDGIQLGSRKMPQNLQRKKDIQSSVVKNEEINEKKAVPKPRMSDAATLLEVNEKQKSGKISVDEETELAVKSESSAAVSGSEKMNEAETVGRGEKYCHICEREFVTRQVLMRHLTIHTGEKPFQCDECAKGFRTLHEMKQHKITHSDVKPFHCTTCQKGFTIKESLKRHRRLVHDDEMI